MVFILFIMGVPSIREFALPIMVGIVAGTYSSVFLSSIFWYYFSNSQDKRLAAQREAREEERKARKKRIRAKEENKKDKNGAVV